MSKLVYGFFSAARPVELQGLTCKITADFTLDTTWEKLTDGAWIRMAPIPAKCPAHARMANGPSALAMSFRQFTI